MGGQSDLKCDGVELPNLRAIVVRHAGALDQQDRRLLSHELPLLSVYSGDNFRRLLHFCP